MKATLGNYRQSPRKVRLVTDLVKGKNVAEAFSQLRFLPKRAAAPIVKLINSALAYSKEKVLPEAVLIKDIRVDGGVTLKRFRPRARGRASRINKRTSIVRLTLTPKV